MIQVTFLRILHKGYRGHVHGATPGPLGRIIRAAAREAVVRGHLSVSGYLAPAPEPLGIICAERRYGVPPA